MIKTAIYIIEILSVLQCIHCVFGERQKINKVYILTALSLWITLEITNIYSAGIEGTFTMYCILAIYCILSFKRNARELIICTAIYMILVTVIQLCFGIVISTIYSGDRLISTLMADIFVLMFSACILPHLEVHKITGWLFKKNSILFLAVGYIFLIICNLLFRIKTDKNLEIRVGLYLSVLPLIICVYFLTKQWNLYQGYYEREKKELQLYREDKKAYAGLVSKIRSRQHEINNHLTAILALHYTTETYEDLVKMQSEYCDHILSDNKFNSLLSLNNSILSGFLIDKFSFIESKEITVECKVIVDNYESNIPEYYLVEMLGILLDNAVEAVRENALDKKVYFEIRKIEDGYAYLVRNPYQYVSYEEIGTWFAYEKSSKGNGRGIGLYHLKCLCEEWQCELICRNINHEGQNWIEFIIETDRKDR